MASTGERSPKARSSRGADDGASLRSARLEAALGRAVAEGDAVELFDLLERSSGLPGPRPNLDFAEAVGRAITRFGGKGDPLLRALLASDKEFPRIVAALALGARSLAGVDTRGALDELQTLAEDPRHAVRSGVIAALRLRITALGEAAVAELAAWTDGYLQAHVALEALADRVILDALPARAPVLARLEEAFALADTSPRAAERSQGVRALRAALPAQIAAFAARLPETIAWLERTTAAQRPETREVVEEAIRALRRAKISDAEAKRLRDALEASAPPARDAARVVHGTRKRSKGRR
jgi:hypothetical protein